MVAQPQIPVQQERPAQSRTSFYEMPPIVQEAEIELSRALEYPDVDSLSGAIRLAITCINKLEGVLVQERFSRHEKERRDNELLHLPKEVMNATERIITRELIRQAQHAQTSDAEGRVRINDKSIAKACGSSPASVSRTRQFLEAAKFIVESVEKTEKGPNGEPQSRNYIKLNEDLIANPRKITPPAPRPKQGGDRYHCPVCGAHHMKLITRKIVACVNEECSNYNKELLISETSRIIDADRPDEEASVLSNLINTETENFSDLGNNDDPLLSNLINTDDESATPDCNLLNILKPSTPPQIVLQLPTSSNPIQAAAQVLLAIAGDIPLSIEMAQRPGAEKKYYALVPQRGLTLRDMYAHIDGRKTYGALCAYATGQTRAYCADADTPEHWAILQGAAAKLAIAGYKPLLETSPAGRGGHLWIIYSDMVHARAARRSILAIAPELIEITEQWPSLKGDRENRVRLPGGKYTAPLAGINEWCVLTDASGHASTDGASAAALLLANITPAAIVLPVIDSDCEEIAPAVGVSRRQLRQSETASECRPETVGGNAGQEVDARHKQKYQAPLHFQWGKDYLIRRFNKSHTLEDILPLEANGMALSPLHNERTASVGYWKDGTLFTDFSQGARYTGDAFELEALVHHGGNKGDLARSLANDLIRDARLTLESAAANGQELPSWVQEILAPAGQALYDRLREQSGYASSFNNIKSESESGIKLIYYINSEEQPAAQPVAAMTETAIASESTGGVLGLKPTTLDLWGFATVLRVGDWVPMPDRPEAGPAQIVEMLDNGDYTVLYFGNLRTYSHDGSLLSVTQK